MLNKFYILFLQRDGDPPPALVESFYYYYLIYGTFMGRGWSNYQRLPPPPARAGGLPIYNFFKAGSGFKSKYLEAKGGCGERSESIIQDLVQELK